MIASDTAGNADESTGIDAIDRGIFGTDAGGVPPWLRARADRVTHELAVAYARELDGLMLGWVEPGPCRHGRLDACAACLGVTVGG